MSHRSILPGIFTLALTAGLSFWHVPDVRAQDQPERMASQAHQILFQYCFDCHGKDPKRIKGKLNLFEPKVLYDKDRKIVVEKAPTDSKLILLIEDESMPPGKRPKVPLAERKMLREWISTGARPFLPVKPEENPRAAGPVLAASVKEIFRAHCFDCHGGKAARAGIRVMDRDLLVKKEALVPGKPDDSTLFHLIVAKDEPFMPPRERPRLNERDVDCIRRWIAEGAPALPADVAVPVEKEKDAPLKNVVGVDYVLKRILENVRTLRADDKPYVRYFSINHILTAGATKEALELQRAALAKAINHLSYEIELVHPEAIDPPANTVFRVDIRALGWHKQPYHKMKHTWEADGTLGSVAAGGKSDVNLFDLILLEYPYAVVYEDSQTYDQLVQEFLLPAGQVRPIPYLRSDWFVSVATQPPLYEDLLQMPYELAHLEEKLGCDSQANLDAFRAKRAGMILSGVSRNNRVVERQPARNSAYYWKSFDFRSSKGQENMFQNPIHLYQSGGEMIFALPNGMQAYFICDNAGKRLEAAPTDIVVDKFAEDKIVRNGLACIRCHDSGMKEFIDTVRPALERLPGSPGFDKRSALDLYPEQARMDEYLKQDRKRFTDALEKLFGKKQTVEPLIPVTNQFLDREISLPIAGAELGLAEPGDLKAFFRLPQFAALGLVPLASEGVVRRDMWEDYYDQVVRYTGTGIPLVPLDGVIRRDYQTNGALDVVLKTNKKNNIFAPGDSMEIQVVNHSDKDIYIELIGTDTQGKKVILAPATTVVKARQTYRWGPFKIQPKLGKEQATVFACDRPFPAGELLRGDDVSDRFVHPFYYLDRNGKRTRFDFDPARMVKKTIEFETR